MIALAAVLFAADQYVYQHAGTAVLRQAPLDWTDHLLTTLFIVWALRGLFPRALLPAALVASVLIDADHIPGQLGSHILDGGTPRPYTHSFLTIVVLLTLALARRRWRMTMFGAALGVTSHLWRDLAEPAGTGVSLLWPVSDRAFSTPGTLYLGSIALLAAVALFRAALDPSCGRNRERALS